jgi:hypothetical protein
MNVCATEMNADRARRFQFDGEHFMLMCKPARRRHVSPLTKSQEIDMSRKSSHVSRLAIAACAILLPLGSAFASQGPGGGMGTAGNLTQVTMAVLVYGASALIVGAGLIGALRRHTPPSS